MAAGRWILSVPLAILLVDAIQLKPSRLAARSAQRDVRDKVCKSVLSVSER
jgi:hypothetical protein